MRSSMPITVCHETDFRGKSKSFKSLSTCFRLIFLLGVQIRAKQYNSNIQSAFLTVQLQKPHRLPLNLRVQKSLFEKNAYSALKDDLDPDKEENLTSIEKNKLDQLSLSITKSSKHKADDFELSDIRKKTQSFGALSIIAPISFLTVSLLAYTGIIGGEGSVAYTKAFIVKDLSASIITAVAAAIFVKSITSASKNGLIESRDSRKMVHILSAPLFIFCWPLFSNMDGARFFAALVPFLNAVRLYIAGRSDRNLGDESELAGALSRSGDEGEALQGPFIYVIILLGAVLGFWRSSMIGVVSLAVMAAGDGAADIVGRRFGKNNKWFFNPDKSIAGTLAFIMFSFITSMGLISWLNYSGCLVLSSIGTSSLIVRLSLVCGLSSLIELIPIGDDNWNVPIFAGVLTAILFPT